FGKQIQAQQIPGWSQYYLDYKFLKKIVSSLSKSRPASEAASLAVGIRPGDLLRQPSPNAQPTLWPSRELATPGSLTAEQTALLPQANPTNEEERGAAFQAHKAAFFFKLERELEKINTFYLQKEAELKLRLETLLSKRKAAASRFASDVTDETATNSRDYVELKAVEEGFRLLERDLMKLQQFVEMNATGFRKILKKWDKRSKSTTKELYLARQVEVQPVFNRQLLAALSNTVTECLVDITNVSIDPSFQVSSATEVILSQQITLERTIQLTAFSDLENDLRKAIAAVDEDAVRNLVRHARNLQNQEKSTTPDQEGSTTLVNRILWKTAIDAPPALADIIMASPDSSFDFCFIDDINGRTCLHEAAIAGTLRLVELCFSKGIQITRNDVYGRSALHYAAMWGHADVCKRLLDVGIPPDEVDMDNYTPLIHAIVSGSVDCVNVLLEDPRVTVTQSDGTDLSPLALACRFGRVDVALLLINKGAKSLPNTNGEYPMHLAAAEGHADICRLLINLDGCDVKDKYNEWTPLFHAAANGHEACLNVLLDTGCKSYTRDETGRLAVFYAAWNGHVKCASALLDALQRSPGAPVLTSQTPPTISPLSDFELVPDGDGDNIPSLSLPPPIIPFRVYGHNYLDKSVLVQVTLGHPLVKGDTDPNAAIKLIPRLIGTTTMEYPNSAPSLKLVIASLPDKSSAHHAVSFPIKSKSLYVFAFQMQSTDNLSLEFSIYPSLGSKAVGRAVALPSMFENIGLRSAYTLPLLDYRLHVIGQVSMEVSIIRPFRNVTLEIGGSVETYWKSVSGPSIGGSTSPSVYSPNLSTESGGVILSSHVGNYVHAVVQVTRDMHPVVYSRWTVRLSEEVEVGIAELSLSQLLRIAERDGFKLDLNQRRPISGAEWAVLLNSHFIPLTDLLQVLPGELGISLELAYPTPAICGEFNLNRSHDINSFVDSVLVSAYSTLSGPDEVRKTGKRRKLVFSSFSPDVCASLNWKQPNYAVFFATDCGVWAWPAETMPSVQVDRTDRRCQSVAAAVEFAKSNNLLGILVNSFILNKVPWLISGVREAGLLLAAFGGDEQMNNADIGTLDARMRNGLLTFTDNSSRI
ncbi:hypothetical protein M422DRAFT_148482, partial [Sphaerobolus stellatus SS14]